MYTLTPLLVLLIWNGLGMSLLHRSDTGYIIEKARLLCPYNSICGEPPLATTAITPGNVPCCRDCSCEPDCSLRNDCCFPAQTTSTIRNECLAPVSKQTTLLFGSLRYHMVVDAMTCQHAFAVKETLPSLSKAHSDNATDENGENCGKCSCDINIETNSYTNCVCDKHILNQSDDCTCGDVKVAPWGSLFPVYSRISGLIYKNPICAMCHGIKDGIIWNPFVTCQFFSLHFVEDMLGKAFSDERCTAGFTCPKSLEQTQLPRCFGNGTVSCFEREIPSSLGLNMTTDEIQDACVSNFTSPFLGKHKNVFCYLCQNYPMTECVDTVVTRLWDNFFFTILLNDVLLEDKPSDCCNKTKIACSKSSPTECRKIVCPSGRVRNVKNDCVYPMVATYVKGYFVTLRLYSDTFNLQKIVSSQPRHTIHEGQLKSPWPQRWLEKILLLETSRLNQFGELVNTSSFIVQVVLVNLHSNNIKAVLRDISRSLDKTWTLQLTNDTTIDLKSEFCEYSDIIFSTSTNAIVPGGFKYNSVMNITAPTWKLQWARNNRSLDLKLKSSQSITRLMFCDQVMLHPHEYSLSTDGNILYMKSDHKYFFGAQFAYYADGDRSVRVCLDDTELMKAISSSQFQHVQDVAFCAIVIAILFDAKDFE